MNQFWYQCSLCNRVALWSSELMDSEYCLLKSKSYNLSVPSVDYVDHNAILVHVFFCHVFLPSLGAEGLPLSSTFVSVIISFCCLDLLSCQGCLPLVWLGNFTRRCCQHAVHASHVLMNMSTMSAITTLPLPLTCFISSASSCIPNTMCDACC